MAELLVLNRDHWTDQEGYTESNLPPGWDLAKFQRRQRRGDIVNVYPDGWADQRTGWGEAFTLITVPGITVEQARQYLGTVLDGPDGNTIRKFRFSVPTARLTGARVDINAQQVSNFVAAIVDNG